MGMTCGRSMSRPESQLYRFIRYIIARYLPKGLNQCHRIRVTDQDRTKDEQEKETYTW